MRLDFDPAPSWYGQPQVPLYADPQPLRILPNHCCPGDVAGDVSFGQIPWWAQPYDVRQ
jgi:hypothetical protein